LLGQLAARPLWHGRRAGTLGAGRLPGLRAGESAGQLARVGAANWSIS